MKKVKLLFLIIIIFCYLPISNVLALRLPEVPVERWVVIDGGICQETMMEITGKLLELDQTGGDIRIRMFSPGGEVIPGLAIIDVIETLKNDVQILVEGRASSMAMYVLAVGTKGKRAITKHTEIYIHQIQLVKRSPFPGVPAVEIPKERISPEVRKRIRETQLRCDAILYRHTKVTWKELAEWDNLFILADEIIKYEIADGIYEGEQGE